MRYIDRKIKEPNLNLEKEHSRKNQYNYFIGIDEVGRGSLAGPIVACSCWINPNNFTELPDEINDSKTLTKVKRNQIYNKTQNLTLRGIAIASSNEIEKYGLVYSNNLAINRSLHCLLKNMVSNYQLKEKLNFLVYLDGNTIPDFEILKKKKSNLLTLPDYIIKSKIKGDKRILSISLASIIAKVTRDTIMINYDKKYPEYNFSRNKGYGTKDHMNKIDKLGICNIHRKNFKPMSTKFSQSIKY